MERNNRQSQPQHANDAGKHVSAKGYGVGEDGLSPIGSKRFLSLSLGHRRKHFPSGRQHDGESATDKGVFGERNGEVKGARARNGKITKT